MRYFLALLLFFPFHTAHAAQPISVSLAECSVIYNVTSVSAAANGKPAKQVYSMRRMSDVFKAKAYETAEAEGQADAKTYINEQLAAFISKWDERWLSASTAQLVKNLPENMEWVQYCGKLGKDRGLLPLKR